MVVAILPNTITIMAQTKVINVAIFCDVVVTAGALSSLSGLRENDSCQHVDSRINLSHYLTLLPCLVTTANLNQYQQE